MKRRMLSLFLSAQLLLSTVPVTAYASQPGLPPYGRLPAQEYRAAGLAASGETPAATGTGEPTPSASATPGATEPQPTPTAEPSAIPGATATPTAEPTATPGASPTPAAGEPQLMPLALPPAVTGTLEMESTLGAGSAHDIALMDSSSYNLTMDITAESLTNPRLVITVPKNITVTYYPNASNTTLAGSLAAIPSPVTCVTDTEGRTVLTYCFKANVTTVGFNITLAPTYRLKTGGSYRVDAVLYDDALEQAAVSDTITVASNPTLSLGAYYFSYQVENVILKESAEYYYAKMNGFAYTPYITRYAYDSLELIVPLPADAEPGYYEGDVFVPLAGGTAHSFDYGTVTYYPSYDLVNPSGATVAAGKKVVVYRLTPSSQLISGSYYNYHYYFNSNMGSLYLRFPGSMAAGDYKAPASAAARAYIDGDTEHPVWLASYNTGATTVYYQFKQYNIADFFNQNVSYGCVDANSDYYVLNLENNSYFYGYYLNKTGETIRDIEAAYTIPQELNCYKLAFTLSADASSGYPASVTVEYRTRNHPETRTIIRTADDATLTLTDTTDAITYAKLVFDSLASQQYTRTLVNGYVINRNDVDSATPYPVRAQILSATPTGSIADIPIGTQGESARAMYLSRAYAVRPGWNMMLSPSSLSKGDTFRVQFIPTDRQVYLTDPCFYVLMPSQYIFSSYQSGFTNAQYSISQRSITVTGDTANAYAPEGSYTLYTIRFTGGKTYKDYAWHILNFTVGPEVDTATLHTGVYLPAAIAMTNGHACFPYTLTDSSFRMLDIWDFDGDGDSGEYLPTMGSRPTATINAVRTISAQSYLSSSYTGSGENLTQNYRYDSTGTYKLYINNGLESGNTAKNATVTISLPKTAYPAGGRTSLWNARLTGAPVLSGAFLAGASVLYSTDGGSTWAAEAGDYAAVTNVRITTASDLPLESSQSAVIALPFAADFPQGLNSAASAYFKADFSYYLNGASTLSTTDIPVNTLTAAPAVVSGSVFKDYDADGTQGPSERNNSQYYSVYLYKGAYTSGETGLTFIASASTAYDTGAYSFNQIWLPGTYTLRVIKSAGEYFPGTGLFTQDGSGNDAYYSFTLDEGTATVTNANLGIVAPRTVSLNASSFYLYYQGASRKIVPTINPALTGAEAVTYTSSDEGVVTVAADGTLGYVADGNATITVSVPQLAALTSTFGTEPIVLTVGVYARHSSYTLTYRSHEGADITATLPGAYSGSLSYAPNTFAYLPSTAPGTRAGYDFAGWWTAQSGGSRVYYILTTDYGDKDLYARWTAQAYGITYAGMAGATFGASHPGTHTYGTATVISDPEKSGYVFAGWTINGGAEAFKALTLGAEGYTANITLTATWVMAEPAVTLSSDAAGNTVTYGAALTVTAAVTHGLGAAYRSYAWYRDVPTGADALVGTNSPSLTLGDVAQSGAYYCVVTVSDGTLSAQGQSTSITVAINRAAGSVTGLADIGKTYDGETVNPPAYGRAGDGTVTVQYKRRSDADTLYSTTAPADAGEYTVRVTAAQGSNHAEASATRDFAISTRTITVTPASGTSKIFGEADPALGYATNASSQVVTGQTIVITGEPGRAAGEDVGSYAINLGTLALGDGTGGNAFRAANYALALAAEPVYFTIGKAAMSVTSSGYSGEYDDASHGITVDAPEGATVYYKLADGEWTTEAILLSNAGPAVTVYYKAVKPNYLDAEGSETVTIDKRLVTVTAASAEKPYDGTALTDGGYSVTSGSFAAGQGFESVTVEGSRTLTGASPNTIVSYELRKGTDEANYSITTLPGTLTVNQAEIKITITALSAAKTYDGTPLTQSGWELSSGTLAAGDGIASVSVYGSITNSGTAANTVGGVVIKHGDADVTANYSITKADGTLTVHKRPIELTAGSAEKVYDGTALTTLDWSLTGGSLADGDAIQSAQVSGSITDCGTQASAVGGAVIRRGETDVTANYIITAVDGMLAVTKRPVEVTAESLGKVYDGTALTAGGSSVTTGSFAPGEGFAGVQVEGSCLFPGTAAAKVTSYTLMDNTKAGNYQITARPGTLTVRRAEIPIRITASDMTQVYNGKPLTSSACTVRGTFAAGDKLSVTVAGSITDAGTAANTVTQAVILHGGVDVTGNYVITTEPGTLTVERMPYASGDFIITGLEERQPYTGRAVTPVLAITAGGAELAQGRDYTATYGSNVEPGTATVTIRFTGNYTGTANASFTILEPVVTTVVPDGITARSATLKGTVSAAAGETGFYYKAADGSQYTKAAAGSAAERFEHALGGLMPDTVYVYQAYLNTGAGEYKGREVRFRTAAEAAPQSAAPTGRVDVGVINGTGAALSGTLSIERGNTVTATAQVSVVVGQSYSHSFENLEDGQYNIVLHVGQFTQTNKVRILGGVTEKTEFRVASLAQNSVVEVRNTAPQVAVGGISGVYGASVQDPEKGITQQELETGRDIEIRVVVDEVSAVDEQRAADMGLIEKLSDGRVGIFIDFSVIKTVTYADSTARTKLTEVPGLLDIAIPIPDGLRGKSGYVIYRVHAGVAEAITETPNADGEYIEVTGDGYILLHVRKFSTYAIGFADVQPVANHDFNWWLLSLIGVCAALLAVIIILLFRGTKKRVGRRFSS